MSKYFLFIALTVVLNSASQMLMKKGMAQVGAAEMSVQSISQILLGAAHHPLILLGLLSMTVSMLTHLLSLSRFEVSYAFPFLSLAYVIVTICGYLLLNESLSASKAVGIATIIAGTILISRG